MVSNQGFSVGRVAKRCGINVSTLHFYEEKGLIVSWRNNGNQRRYEKSVFRRVSVIKAAQKMGITLAEIKQALDLLPKNRTPNTRDWSKMATGWQVKLNDRIAYLERLRDSLNGCIGCGCLSMKLCPLHNPDDELAKKGAGPIILENPSAISPSLRAQG